VFATLGLLLSLAPVTAQQPTFRSPQTIMVPLMVTVVDAQQRLVTGLERDDFTVLDNDKPEPLTIFENRNQPITAVVMIDTSASMTLNLTRVRDAAEQFVLRLFPGDKARVGAFNDKIQMTAEFTSDRDALTADLRTLDYGNGTLLWDAMIMSLDALRGIDGRRVILVLTDGADYGSRAGFGTVVDRVRSQDVMVYAIGLAGEDPATGTRNKPDGGLKRLAQESGGGYFELDDTADLGSTFTRVAQELHSQYILGFAPRVLDNKTHKLAVKLKPSGLTARTRQSYVAVKPEDRN
jgi:Ca-activated chloride channel family protein